MASNTPLTNQPIPALWCTPKTPTDNRASARWASPSGGFQSSCFIGLLAPARIWPFMPALPTWACTENAGPYIAHARTCVLPAAQTDRCASAQWALPPSGCFQRSGLIGFFSSGTCLAALHVVLCRHEPALKHRHVHCAPGLYRPAAARSAAALVCVLPTAQTDHCASAQCALPSSGRFQRGGLIGFFSSGTCLAALHVVLCRHEPALKHRHVHCAPGLYRPAAARSAAALSVFSQVNSGSLRPKWP